MSAHSFLVRLIYLDKGLDLITVRRRCNIVPMFTYIKISFLAVAKAYINEILLVFLRIFMFGRLYI